MFISLCKYLSTLDRQIESLPWPCPLNQLYHSPSHSLSHFLAHAHSDADIGHLSGSALEIFANGIRCL